MRAAPSLTLALGALLAATALAAQIPGLAWPPGGPPAAGGGGSVAETTVDDPVGDTFGSGKVQNDIVEFSAAYDANNLYLGMAFADPISPPGSGQPNELAGFVGEFDIDQDPGTGIPGGNVSIFCPQSVNFGVDYFLGCGTCFIYNENYVPLVPIEGTYGADRADYVIPLSAIEGDDGILDTAAVIGTPSEPTDCVPDGGFITTDLVPVELQSFAVE